MIMDGLEWKFVTLNAEISVSIFIGNSVKTHYLRCYNLRQWRDLPILVNESDISPNREDFIFTKLRICQVSRK